MYFNYLKKKQTSTTIVCVLVLIGGGRFGECDWLVAAPFYLKIIE